MPEPDGPRDGQTGSDPELKLLILGDSSAAGVGCETQDQALSGLLSRRIGGTHSIRWRLLAKTGWTTKDAEAALTELGDETFDLAVICLGVNDITTETGVDTWLATYDRVLAHLRAANGVKHFVVSGLPPMGRFPALPHPLRWYMGLQKARHQRALEAWATARSDVTEVPLDFDSDPSEMAEDGFHPGPAIYERWEEQLSAAIQGPLADPAGSEPATTSQQVESGAQVGRLERMPSGVRTEHG